MKNTLIVIVLLLAPVRWSAGFAQNRNDDDALRTYYSGNGFLNRGLYDLAAAEYRKFLAEHSDHDKADVARYGLGVSLFQQRLFKEAATELIPLADKNDFAFAPEVSTLLGQAYLTLQEYKKAAESFTHVVEHHRDHELGDDAAAGLCEVLYRDGEFEEAIHQSRTFVRRWNDSPLGDRVEFFRGLSAMQERSYEQAAERFSLLLEKYPQSPFAEHGSLLLAQCYHNNSMPAQAVGQYREVLKNAGSSFIPEALLGLGQLLIAQEQPDEAGALLDQLLKSYPDHALVPVTQLYRGRAWFQQAQYDEAQNAFNQVGSERDDLQDDVAFWMAKCSLRQGQFTNAARQLEKAIKEFPKSEWIAELRYDHALALVRLARYDEAVGVLASFRSDFSDHTMAAEALHLLAVVEHQRGNYGPSAKHCEEFLKTYESYELAPVVLFLAAENDYLSGQLEQAIERYEQYLDTSPYVEESVRAQYRLGMALYRQGRLNEAYQRLSAVVGGGLLDGQPLNDAYRQALAVLGDIHFRRSEWKDAQDYFSRFLERNLAADEADDATFKLGLSLQRQGQLKEALAVYDRFLDCFASSPHHLQAVFERGQVLWALDRAAEAQEAFENVLANGKDSRFAPFAQNHLGSIALKNKRFDEAAGYFAKATEKASGSVIEENAVLERGLALLADHKYDESEQALKDFLKRFPVSSRAGEAQARLAIAVARQDHFEDSLKLIERVERESLAALSPSLLSAIQYEKAWALRKLDRSNEAVTAYKSLLEGEPSVELQAHALLDVAEIEAASGRCEEAIPHLHKLHDLMQTEKSLTGSEIKEQGLYRLAVCRFEDSELDLAVSVFEELIDQFPDSDLTASASLFCGEALVKLGRHEQAVKHLRRIVDEFPEDSSLGPAMLRLGEALAVLQKWSRSESVFTDYLSRFSSSEQWFQAQFGVGWAQENQQRYEEAMSAYHQVIERHKGPTAARAQFQTGECLFSQNKPKEAVAEFLKVDILYGYPEWSSAALFEAGRCFQKMGQSVEARKQFKDVVDRFAETRWAQMASAQLTQISSSGGLPGR